MTKAELLRKTRAKCLDCCCGSVKEVTLCTVGGCSLYDVRLGKDPTKRVMSEEKKLALGQGLARGRKAKKLTPTVEENVNELG